MSKGDVLAKFISRLAVNIDVMLGQSSDYGYAVETSIIFDTINPESSIKLFLEQYI